MNRGTISIIIPVYNVAKELIRCIGSVDSQSYKEIQVVLVDDGSTDGSGDLCDELASDRPELVVVHKTNGGLSSARNAGLNVAKGDWIMYLDSDDALMPDACEGLIRTAWKFDPDIVVGDAVREISEEREEMRHSSLKRDSLYTNKDFIIEAIKSHEFYAPACFNMYKRQFLESNNLVFAEGLLHEDMEMQPRVFLAAQTVAYTGVVFYRYIDRSTSIMNASKDSVREMSMQSIYAQWKRQFDSVDDEILRQYLYGHLAKCYLKTVRDLKCESLNIEGIDGRFLFTSGLNLKEKLKALLYITSPKAFSAMGGGE